MSERQLKIDLHRRTRERLHVLIGDTFSLYEMAGLEECDAGLALCDVLMLETATMMGGSELSAEMIGAALTLLVKQVRGEISEQEAESIMYRACVSGRNG